MKKEKSFNLISLIKLYLGYLFQKSTIIVFSISLILILLIIFYVSNPFMKVEDYLLGYNEVHLNFFTQSYFVVQLFNSIIIATIAIILAINSISFDTLFVSHTSRVKICLAKIIACIIVLFILSIYEILVINIIPLIRYPMYKINADIFLDIFYLFLSSLTETVISFLLSTAIPIIFVPMIFMFVAIVIKLLSNNFTSFREIIVKIIPIVDVTYKGVKCDAAMLAPIWILLLGMLYFSVYAIRDLKQ